MSLLKDKEHELRIQALEKEVEKLDGRFAIKLTQTLVFTACGALLMGAATYLWGQLPI